MGKDANSVKTLIARGLGIETQDISDDDSLTEDLHMRATDLTDLLEALSENDFDTSRLDLTAIETVSELIEALGVGDT